MKSGTNRLITERYITNTERSVGNLSYICPLPLGFDYPNFTEEAIQDVKKRLISYEETGVAKYYQNVIEAKKENDILILKSKWQPVKAKDIPIFYITDNTQVVIGVDKSIFEVDERVPMLLILTHFQSLAVEVKGERNLLIYGGTVPDLGKVVTILYNNGETIIDKELEDLKINASIETLPGAEYLVTD